MTFVNEFFMDRTSRETIRYVEWSFQRNTRQRIRTYYFDLESKFNSTYLESSLLDFGVCESRYSFSTRFEYNITHLVIDHMKKNSPKDWFSNQSATWNRQFEPAFAEMVTQQGMGFTFNMIDSSALFIEEK